jgi:anti-anti-sigma regulatory factor
MHPRFPECAPAGITDVGAAIMRVTGVVDSVRGLGAQDHLCWVHSSPGDYRACLADFFAHGLDHGLRPGYAGLASTESLRGDLACSGGLLAGETVTVISLEDIVQPGKPADPAKIVARYAVATEEALAAGYRGLRVSADVTDLARASGQREWFASCEFLLERYASRHPLSAMCSYGAELGQTVAQFAALHAAVPAGLTPFQLVAREDGAVGVIGDIDATCQTDFEWALKRLQPADDGFILDLSAVGFMDHRGLLILDEFVQKCPVQVIVRSLPLSARRVVGMLGLDRFFAQPERG